MRDTGVGIEPEIMERIFDPFEQGDRSFDAVAEPLERADHARAVRDMILRYGTPAEGLGHGPSFRLRPVGEGHT